MHNNKKNAFSSQMDYLSVSPDNRTQQFPTSTSPVNSDHSEDLEEPEASECRSGEDFPARTEQKDDDTGTDDDQICWSFVAMEILVNQVMEKYGGGIIRKESKMI